MSFKTALGIDTCNEEPLVTGWVFDTSIEHDHELFSAYLKASLEEIIIALRDDSQLLFEVDKFVEGQDLQGDDNFTLYLYSFTVKKLLNVIEKQRFGCYERCFT